MLIQGDVAVPQWGSPTQQQVTALLGRFRELGMSPLLPPYAMATLAGYTYHASTQAGVALTVGLGTVATGFCLSNAPGSGKVLIPLQAAVVCTTAPVGIAVLGWAFAHHATTIVTHTTPLVVRSGRLSSLADMTGDGGFADSSFTTPATQVAIRPIPGGPVATGSISDANTVDDFDGSMVLMPGASLSTFCLTTAISAIISMSWLALPL